MSLRAAAAERPSRRATGRRRGYLSSRRNGSRGRFVCKTIADPFAGRITMFRVSSGTLKADTTVHNQTRDARERLGNLLLLQGRRRPRSGAQGRRSRRGGQAEGHAHGRPARPTRRPPSSAADSASRAGDLLRHRTEDPRRRRQDRHRAAPAAGRGSDDPLPPRSADEGAPARRPGPVAHRGHGREAEAPLRRRGDAAVRRGSRTARRSPPRPRRTAATRSRPAATASSATARSRSSRCRAAAISSSSNEIFGGSIPRQYIPAVEKGIQDTRLRGFLAGTRWWTSA